VPGSVEGGGSAPPLDFDGTGSAWKDSNHKNSKFNDRATETPARQRAAQLQSQNYMQRITHAKATSDDSPSCPDGLMLQRTGHPLRA
jgi:hypothetical protein